MSDPSTRLERAIAELGAEHRPPEGWEAKVLAAIEAEARGHGQGQGAATAETRPAAAKSRWRWWLAIPLAAVALAAVLLWLVRGPEPLRVELALAPDGPKRGEVMRGSVDLASGQLVLGSRLQITARGGGDRAIRVYRDTGALVAACPAPDAGAAASGDGATEAAAARPVCHSERGALILELSFAYIGSYQAVVLAGDAALPASAGSFDTDAAAASAAHAVSEIHELEVR